MNEDFYWKNISRHGESIMTEVDRQVMALYTITEKELSVPG